MNDSTDPIPSNGDHGPLAPNDRTVPVNAGGTIDHQPAPVLQSGTAEFSTDAIGTLDFKPAGDPLKTRGGQSDRTTDPDGAGGTVDHVANPSGGTVDHVPDPSSGTVDPTEGKPVGGSTAPAKRGKHPVPKSVAGYDILGVLGRGAMGVVYKARQRGLNRLVALKMILSGTHASEHELSRFRIEAEAVARIKHPNIVQIYDIGEEDGRPYFSLEFVDGGTLNSKIDGKPQPPTEAARLLQALATGMDCAHKVNVLHRDLKPANVLLAADGTPKITDFGLAKRLEEDAGQTNIGTVLGTPSYMSPEQAGGLNNEVGPLSDVYSLGVILYEMLTGRVPFQAPKILETLELVRTREPVAPTELQPAVPRDLETICLKCLQKDPLKRYAGAGALAEDLRRYLNNEPILARPVGQIERAWRWSKRNPVGAGLVAAVVFWAFSVSGLAWTVYQQKNATEEARLQEVEARIQADKNEKEATKNWQKAVAAAKIANSRHATSLTHLTTLGEELQRYMQQMGTQFSVQRRGILNILRKKMMAMARDLEASEASSFATAGSYEQMGSLLRRLGQSEEALKQYRLAVATLEKNVADNPNSDKGRANLAMARVLVTDMTLDLDAEFQTARDNYEKLRLVRQEIADQPRSGDLDELETKLNLAHYHRRIALTDLALGDSAAARDQLKKAFELRSFQLNERKDKDTALSYLSEIHVLLGGAASRLGDNKMANEEFAKAKAVIEDLIARNRGATWFLSDMATLLRHMGDAQMRLHKISEARKSYREAIVDLKPELDRLPNHAEYLLEQAMLHEGLALIAEFEGNTAGAIKTWEKALDVRKELLEIEPKNLLWKVGALRDSAHCGRFAGAVGQLEKICQLHPQSIPILLDTARACAVGVARSGDAATKQRYAERAIGALRTAVRAGYKDAYALKTDPDMAPLTKEPDFAKLLAEIPKQ